MTLCLVSDQTHLYVSLQRDMEALIAVALDIQSHRPFIHVLAFAFQPIEMLPVLHFQRNSFIYPKCVLDQSSNTPLIFDELAIHYCHTTIMSRILT